MDLEIKKALETGLTEISNQLKKSIDTYDTELQKHGKATTELTGQIEDLAIRFKEIRDEFIDLAQKQTPGVKGVDKIETAGSEFVMSEAFKALQNTRQGSARVELKNTIVADTTTTQTFNRPGVVGGDFQPMTVRQLIPTIPVSSNSVSTLREASWTNNAAPVAQAALKPESDLVLEPYNVPVETIAHWVKVSKQLIQDAPAVRAYIDVRLRDGLAQAVERQLIIGDGVAPNLSGLTDAGNFTAYTATAGDNLVDAINRAKYARWGVGVIVDTVIVNPADWASVVLMREGNGTGQYLFGAPGTNAGTNPFGLNLVLSPHVPVGNFIVADLRGSTTIYQNEGAVVEMGFVNDDFTRNLVTIRAEERLGLAVEKPAGVLYGAFTTV